MQISPGMTYPPSRLCLSDLRHGVPQVSGFDDNRRLTSGEISVPDDFDSLAATEMIQLFEGKLS